MRASSPSELDVVLSPFVAPRTAPRHSFTLGVADELARRFLTERVPYSFKEHADTRVHVVARVGQKATISS